jgi:hypothetical protein
MTRKLLILVLITAFLVPGGAAMAQNIEEPLATVAIPVDIDIKPGSCDNPVNFKSRGVVPVAIVLEQTMTPAEIREITVDVSYKADPNSLDSVLLLSLEPVRTMACDISTPGSECGSRARDGLMDVLVKFRTQDLVQALSDEAGVKLENGDQQEITLLFTATLPDGTTLEGSDTILAKRSGRAQGPFADRFQNRNKIRDKIGKNTNPNNGNNNCVENNNCTNNCTENCNNNGIDNGSNGTDTGTGTQTTTETNTRTGLES